MLKFHLITDTHYYAYEKLGFSDHMDQVTVNESGAIIDAVIDKLLAETDTDLVLLAGDLCTGGDRANHEGLLPKLRRLKDGGKRVFALTASHDYFRMDHREDGDEGPRSDMVYREELSALYWDFGRVDAAARYEPDPLSYVAQLASGYRLLCLNTDGSGSHEALYDWAEAEVRRALAEGQFIFAMHHYPVLAPSPVYPLLAPDALDNGAGIRERLADAGLRFVFTGHTHMQNISCMTTPAGNRLYDINTGAAVGYNAPIRTVTIHGGEMTVTTGSIDSFAWDLQGKCVSQYLSDSFDRMLNSIFEAANADIARMLDILNGEFRVDKAALLKYKPLLSLAGKFLYRLTFGGAGTLLGCRRKIPKTVRNVRVKDFIMEVVRNIYGGDEAYSADTPQGAATFAVMGRLEKLARSFLKNADLPFDSLQRFVMSLLYDGGLPDNNAVLPLENDAAAPLKSGQNKGG
ncbi:MAG: metallophosphoesterase [Oscillospiraceae bacterium]|nr:metallophosphoesterase [Oscillospiraceae bacterium]